MARSKINGRPSHTFIASISRSSRPLPATVTPVPGLHQRPAAGMSSRSSCSPADGVIDFPLSDRPPRPGVALHAGPPAHCPLSLLCGPCSVRTDVVGRSNTSRPSLHACLRTCHSHFRDGPAPFFLDKSRCVPQDPPVSTCLEKPSLTPACTLGSHTSSVVSLISLHLVIHLCRLLLQRRVRFGSYHFCIYNS